MNINKGDVVDYHSCICNVIEVGVNKIVIRDTIHQEELVVNKNEVTLASPEHIENMERVMEHDSLLRFSEKVFNKADRDEEDNLIISPNKFKELMEEVIKENKVERFNVNLIKDDRNKQWELH